jgi:hypothetical protein
VSDAGDRSQESPKPKKAYPLFPTLRGYGVWNILRSGDLYLAFLVAFVLVLFVYLGQPAESVGPQVASLLATSITLSGAILGLILAAFAIIMGFSEPKFTLFLKHAQNALSDVVALFWYVGLLAASAASVGLIALVISARYASFGWLLLLVASFLTLYALFGAVGLVRMVGKLTLARADFLEIKESK